MTTRIHFNDNNNSPRLIMITSILFQYIELDSSHLIIKYEILGQQTNGTNYCFDESFQLLDTIC